MVCWFGGLLVCCQTLFSFVGMQFHAAFPGLLTQSLGGCLFGTVWRCPFAKLPYPVPHARLPIGSQWYPNMQEISRSDVLRVMRDR